MLGGKDILLLRFYFAEASFSTGCFHFRGVVDLMCLSKYSCPWVKVLSLLSETNLKAWACFQGFLYSLVYVFMREKKKNTKPKQTKGNHTQKDPKPNQKSKIKKQEPVDLKEMDHFIAILETPNNMKIGTEN